MPPSASVNSDAITSCGSSHTHTHRHTCSVQNGQWAHSHLKDERGGSPVHHRVTEQGALTMVRGVEADVVANSAWVTRQHVLHRGEVHVQLL